MKTMFIRRRFFAFLAACGVAWMLLVAFTLPILAEDQPDKWEADIRKFEEQDRATAPPPEPILFVGSSSIRLWDLKKSFSEFPAINRGFGGSQVSDVLRYTDRIVLPYHPKQIVFYAGDNDIASGKSPKEVADDFGKFVARVHEALPATPIVFISIKPSKARWKLWDQAQEANGLVKLQADADGRLEFLDIGPLLLGGDGLPDTDLFQPDFLHLNADGYQRWTKALEPLLVKTPEP
jgi:lysophospholipase L1-like esterase